MRSPKKFQTPRTILSSKTRVPGGGSTAYMGGSTAYMGVKSNNRVKPNTLVEVRLSCGCVGVLTIPFLFADPQPESNPG